MKSFYILPYLVVHANVLFDTEEKADRFVKDSQNCSCYNAVNKQEVPFAGDYYVSVEYTCKAKDTFLVSLANEDGYKTISTYINDFLSSISFPGNWVVEDAYFIVKCMAECCECGKKIEINLYEHEFEDFMNNVFSFNNTSEFNFLCDTCYDNNKKYNYE
ncbi:hypothetical protein [uncultured Methanobrevibacter sp.]|uniref:hypothetical protein n=1 Tax=uncultured Methanobrevibacter sp. TaxID=253161 RepID=UPI0025E42F5B|nr:hypothetical protein [uncultured Methanobrevibacter sp.]